VPFSLVRNDDGWMNLAPGLYTVNKQLDRLFMLGMTTEAPEGSEWWGPCARWYDIRPRVFIGDRLGVINLNYADGTTEAIPVIFGVNCWFYELFTPLKPGEDDLNTYGGPYPEPFQSDPVAGAMLRDSLLLEPNDGEKRLKYVFGIAPKPVEIASLEIKRYDHRSAGFVVSAITGVWGGSPSECAAYSASFFLRQEYYPAMDRLARRLYQFQDEIPSAIPLDRPEGYRGPNVRFSGDNLAEAFTNVYCHNAWDMVTDKVDADGAMHTSSRHAPNFGLYVGFGTHSDNAGSYHAHVWTRDVGRSLIEAVEWGECNRTAAAADKLLHYLYDDNTRYTQPNWKRIANAGELNNKESLDFASRKENDGHASIMLFLHRLYRKRCVDRDWLRSRWTGFVDAAEWFGWQIENPAESGFDGVLSSESEASSQYWGMRDLFSNTLAYHAMRAYARLAREVGDIPRSERWQAMADTLWKGMLKLFTAEHPRHGRIFVDNNYGGWTWEYKRFAPLFACPDILTYDLARHNPGLFAICANTYQAQKEDYFSYDAGRQMGYGQGYIAQAAILLDNPDDMRGYVEQAAAFCYHHTDHPWIVPEGVISHPSGRFWFRNGDLGNSVQQAEIVKCARLLVGVDDLRPEAGLTLLPRLPGGWATIEVADYPAVIVSGGEARRSTLGYTYARTADGYSMEFHGADAVDLLTIRVGPFPNDGREISVRGAQCAVEETEVLGSRFVYLKFADALSAAFTIDYA